MKHYEDLANAIIVQAVEDYRLAIQFLKLNPHTLDLDTEEAKKDPEKRALRNRIIKNEGERDAVERFFRSNWFELLSNLDGAVLLHKIRKLVVS